MDMINYIIAYANLSIHFLGRVLLTVPIYIQIRVEIKVKPLTSYEY